MDLVTYVLLAVVVLLVVYAITIYNRLVSMKHNVKKAWGNIDVLLKQRHDELPKLVETCKQYMQYEKDTLEKIIAARSQVASARSSGNVGALGQAEGMLRTGLGQLFALVENYPELKADQNFQHLQTRITGIENTIADRREFYNESVNVYNVGLEQFPDVLIANSFKFTPAELLEFSADELKDADVKSLFNS